MGRGAPEVPAAAVVAALLAVAALMAAAEGGATWCIARSGASEKALQAALDYACGTGADCAPIQQSGLCYLPNTVQAHASYAFNSYYQRRNLAAGSCDFGATATVTITDPSFGSCTYPSSPSTAGGATPATPTANTPATTSPPTTPGTTTPTTTTPATLGGGLTPGFGSTTTDAAAPTTRPAGLLPLLSAAVRVVVVVRLLV